MEHGSMKLREFLRAWEWPLVWAAGIGTLGLGFLGVWWHALAHGELFRWGDAAYLTLKLFTVSLDPLKPPLGWPLEAARFLAPAILGYAAVKAFAVLFREQFQLARLNWQRRHAIVCGLGRKGLELTRAFGGARTPVVVIEADEENDHIEPAVESGAIVLIGDAADRGLLRRAAVGRAQYLIAVTADDGKNVEIALRAVGVARAVRTRSGRKLRCLVHVGDAELRNLFRQQRVLDPRANGCELTVFDFFEICARQLFLEAPLDPVPITSPDDSRRARVIIVGFGNMGESVLLQAAHTAHFANGQRLLATVIDPQAARLQRRFDHRYPGFRHVCDTEFLALEFEDPTVLERLRCWGADARTIETIVLNCDNENRNLSLALHLLPQLRGLNIPVLVRMSSRSGLAALLEGGADAGGPMKEIKPFGMVEDLCSPQMLFDERLDAMARVIHENHVAHRRAKVAPANDPALVPWEQLGEDFRDSCRHQADHLPVKLRALGRRLAPAPTGGAAALELAVNQIEVLARMEHARWCAERFLAGWTYTDTEKDDERKTSPYLVGWDELPEHIKEYDREAVRQIPHLLSAAGLTTLEAT